MVEMGGRKTDSNKKKEKTFRTTSNDHRTTNEEVKVDIVPHLNRSV